MAKLISKNIITDVNGKKRATVNKGMYFIEVPGKFYLDNNIFELPVNGLDIFKTQVMDAYKLNYETTMMDTKGGEMSIIKSGKYTLTIKIKSGHLKAKIEIEEVDYYQLIAAINIAIKEQAKINKMIDELFRVKTFSIVAGATSMPVESPVNGKWCSKEFLASSLVTCWGCPAEFKVTPFIKDYYFLVGEPTQGGVWDFNIDTEEAIPRLGTTIDYKDISSRILPFEKLIKVFGLSHPLYTFKQAESKDYDTGFLPFYPSKEILDLIKETIQ